MKAIEINGYINEKGIIQLEKIPKITNQNVKLIILYSENNEKDETQWLKSISNNPVFDFLKDEKENIYTLEDGKPLKG